MRVANDRDVQMYVAIALVSAVAWWPTRELPYHWDAASFVVEAARDLQAAHFWPPIANHSDFAHPPLFPEMVAAVWTLFGDRRIVTHVFLFIWMPATLLATYALGKATFGRAVGAAAALAFVAAPVALEEYGQVYMDLPLAAFSTAAIWAWTTRRAGLTAFFLCLAAATKIPAAIVPLALSAAQVLDPSRRKNVRMYAALAAPFVVIAAWLAYHRATTGWLLTLPTRRVSPPMSPALLANAAIEGGRRLFFAQGRVAILVATVVAGAALIIRRPHGSAPSAFWRSVATLLTVPIAAWLAFTAFGELAQRYCLFLFPPLFVAAFALVERAGKFIPVNEHATLGALATLVAALELSTLHPRHAMTKGYEFTPEEDLGARDMIKVGLQAAQWVRATYPDAHVYGSFPESYEIAEPYQGYVETPATFTECKNYGSGDDSGRPELVYIHPYSPGQLACNELATAKHAVAEKLFHVNGHWIEIRRIPHDGS